MEFNDREPIYVQIMDAFKRNILDGTYKPGQEVPSRRELAVQLQVNPNTVQRAYKEMEDAGIITTLRGQGSLVTKDEAVLQSLKDDYIRQALARFAGNMRLLGLSDRQIVDKVKLFLEREGERND